MVHLMGVKHQVTYLLIIMMKTLTLLVHAGLFCFFRNPPNPDMDYRIINVRKWSFCMRMHTGDLGYFIVSKRGI